jgi:hypothetical protein
MSTIRLTLLSDAIRSPLLLVGFLALNLPADKLPMPNEALNFRGPWTLWQGD